MRILVVEDEHRIADSIKKGLEQEKYAVDIAYDGNQGLDLSLSEDYDLIILDILLPGINGLAICQKLREAKNHTPILLLTAKGQIKDKVDGLNAGADDYLIKPFAFEELLARIKALLRRPQQVLTESLSLDDLSLNTQTYLVKRGNQEITLSSKEFSLLEYFLRHKDTILTKEQIIAHVWDYNADILINTVEVYIKNLRQKIDKAFPHKHPLLHTVRGYGYKLCSNKLE